MILDNKIGKIIGCRINTLLAEKNLLQKDLAAKLGIKKNLISYFISGTRIPNAAQLIAIADFFKVSTDYLLGRTRAGTMNRDKAFVCDYLSLDEEAVEIFLTYNSMPTAPMHGFYWDYIIKYGSFTGDQYRRFVNRSYRQFMRSRCLTEILTGCAAENALADMIKTLQDYVKSGVPYKELSSFQREKMRTFLYLSVDMIKMHFSNIYGMQSFLTDFVNATTDYSKYNETEVLAIVHTVEEIINEYDEKYGRDPRPEGDTIFSFDKDDKQSIADFIISREMVRPEMKFKLEYLPFMEEDEIEQYMDDIEKILVSRGYDWNDFDFDPELLEAHPQNLYELCEEVFQNITLDREWDDDFDDEDIAPENADDTDNKTDKQ